MGTEAHLQTKGANMSADNSDTKPAKKPWFTANRGGAGFHPQTWQGWVVIIVAVAIIACVIILIKTLR